MRIAVATALLMGVAIGWAAEPAQFKPPGGWRPKRVNGELVYCTKLREYNSRITREECRTEAQLRDQQRADRASREDLEKASRACSGTGCQN